MSLANFSIAVKNQEMPFFCLGTVIYKEEEIEPTSGRLLILTAHSSTSATKASGLELLLVAAAEVKGAVHSLKVVEGKIVAAVNSSVCIFSSCYV